MAVPTSNKMGKPGFLLIEIMCAFLCLVIAGSIMGFYVSLGHRQQKSAQHRFEALLVAGAASEALRGGQLDCVTDKKCQIKVSQKPANIDWADGSYDQIWVAHIRNLIAQEKITLELVLPQKAL